MSNTLISPHGGYKQLESYKTAVIIYDLTVTFCQLHVDRINMSNRSYKSCSIMSNQMVQAARSGKQNIDDGSVASGTSKKTEIKLIGVARTSFAELLEDFEDFLRQCGLLIWGKDSPKAQAIRGFTYKSNRSYKTYKSYIESDNLEVAANTLLCLLNQENFLLDRQLKSLESRFLNEGGFTEKMYSARQMARQARRRAHL